MSLTTDLARDLISDIRCASRDGQPEYAAACRQQLAALYRNRHGVRLDRYGWPVLPEFATLPAGAVEVDTETAYGSAVRLSRSVRVF
jgi:hypothetical protein